MSEVTVKQLASTVGITVGRLLTQLKEAGVSASGPDATLAEQEKRKLLGYLRSSHGQDAGTGDEDGVPSQVRFKRQSVSDLLQSDAAMPRASSSKVG